MRDRDHRLSWGRLSWGWNQVGRPHPQCTPGCGHFYQAYTARVIVVYSHCLYHLEVCSCKEQKPTVRHRRCQADRGDFSAGEQGCLRIHSQGCRWPLKRPWYQYQNPRNSISASHRSSILLSLRTSILCCSSHSDGSDPHSS